MKEYYVYILASKQNGTLYIGMTDDLERRMREHKAKEVNGFTKKHSIDKLMYFETFENSYEAFKRERQMKKWLRKWKLELIEKENPNWHDLAKNWD